jgi:hypothetical protein
MTRRSKLSAVLSLATCLSLTGQALALGTRERDALDLRDAALLATTAMNTLRINMQTKHALTAILPSVVDQLKSTGAPGVLLEARYLREKTAELYSDVAPINLTQKLVGNSVTNIGSGHNPKEVLAISYAEPQLTNGSPSRSEEVVPTATRNFWVTQDIKGNLQIAELDHRDWA